MRKSPTVEPLSNKGIPTENHNAYKRLKLGVINEEPMRRLIVFKQVLVSIMLCSFFLVTLHYHAKFPFNDATTGILSQAIDPPLHSSPIVSPSVPSSPSIAHVARTTNQTQWTWDFTACGAMRCLPDLQPPLSQFPINQTSFTNLNAFHLVSPDKIHQVILNASAICVIELQYTAETFQGETLTIACLVNSSLEHSTALNLSLYHPLVGAIFGTNLLMVRGENVFYLNLDVLPDCPPASYNLSFLLNTPEITLSSDHIPLLINPVFTVLLMELPDRVVQNQLFEATIGVRNHGSKPHLVTISADAYFRGNTQVIVQPNQTRPIPIIVEYCPQNAMDTGVRLLLFTISLSNHCLVRIGTSIFIGYSVINMLITIAPLGLLITLCIVGIRWLRIGKRSIRTRVLVKTSYPMVQSLIESQLEGNNPTTLLENHGIQLPNLTKRIPNSLTKEHQQLGLGSKVDDRVTDNRVTLTRGEDGAEVQITLPANNWLLINQVLNLFAGKIKAPKTEGEPIDR